MYVVDGLALTTERCGSTGSMLIDAVSLSVTVALEPSYNVAEYVDVGCTWAIRGCEGCISWAMACDDGCGAGVVAFGSGS